jgi:hypothetical protein
MFSGVAEIGHEIFNVLVVEDAQQIFEVGVGCHSVLELSPLPPPSPKRR